MNRKNKPKGPSYFSFIAEPVSDRIDYFFELMEDYGDIVKVPTFNRGYLINNAEMIKYVLKDNPENYLRGSMTVKPMEVFLGKGLIMLNGEEWHRRRKAYAPRFTPKHVAQFDTVMQQVTNKWLDYWQESKLGQNESVDISHEVMKIAYQLAVNLLFQQDVSEENIEKALRAIYIDNRYSVSILGIAPWLPTPKSWRYRTARNCLAQQINGFIAEARNNPKPDSFLNLVLQGTHANGAPLTEQAIFDEVKTFLLTGHETTGSVISWSLKLLAEHPEAQKKIKAELAEVLQGRVPNHSDLINLPYTRGVFEESMRLYPPIWLTARICQKDDYIGDYFIKKGSTVLICPYTVHRRECYWDKPLEFIPERHFKDAKNKPPAFALIPFGGGPRLCIASHFANLEAMIIIAMIMQHFEISLDEDTPTKIKHLITLKPKNGIYVNLKPDSNY